MRAIGWRDYTVAAHGELRPVGVNWLVDYRRYIEKDSMQTRLRHHVRAFRFAQRKNPRLFPAGANSLARTPETVRA
jgi:hypothetical protein